MIRFALMLALAAWRLPGALAAEADLVLVNGKIVTVDKAFSVHEAMAVASGRILKVGDNAAVRAFQGAGTAVVDLERRMVMPGLIDSHVHPGAAMTEFDHPIPDMESIGDVLDYVRGRARVVPEGQWIGVQQVFITRLREQRYPTRAELDDAAPRHPVVFRTGPDASLNSLALKLSGIDKDFEVKDGGSGFVEKDAATGEPTGIVRNGSRFIPLKESGKQPEEADHYRRSLELFRDYNSVGLTSVADRSGNAVSIERYASMLQQGELSVRMSVSHHVESLGMLEDVLGRIRAVAANPHCRSNDMLQVIGIKMFLDGGMLTGSAYMREPWGVSRIYSITDPQDRGVLFIPKDRLRPMVRTAVAAGLQFTAHSVGDGAVHTLLDVYAEMAADPALRATRPCLTHANFMSREAVAQMASLGVVADIQPVWLYMDARTLKAQFGDERLRWFQPLRSLFEAGVTVGGGSDHMQKIGAMRSINPYNPFLGMATTVTRRARWQEGRLHPEEALSREQMIRFYTINNAMLQFREDRVGSLEPGKLADFIVLDRDLLSCADEAIAETRVLATYLGGRKVFER